MTSSLSIIIPGRKIGMRGSVYSDCIEAIAAQLDKEMPALTARYGRCAAVVEKGNVAYLVGWERRS